jgi:hypothetical protein
MFTLLPLHPNYDGELVLLASETGGKLRAAGLRVQRAGRTLTADAIVHGARAGLLFWLRLRDRGNRARGRLFASFIIAAENHFASGGLMD